MVCARVLGFMAITLCLMACFCTHAFVSKDEAKKSVEGAQKYLKDVLKAAKEVQKETLALLKDIRGYKDVAEKAAFDAKKAARGKPEAEAMAKKAYNELNCIVKLYPNCYEKANKMVKNITEILSKGKDLDEIVMNKIWPDEHSKTNYGLVKSEALAAKAKTVELYGEVISALEDYVSVYRAHTKMPQCANDAQMAKWRVDALVSADKFDTILNTAETELKRTEQKLDEIKSIVYELDASKNKCRENLLHYCNILSMFAYNNFLRASITYEEATKTKGSMLESKKSAVSAFAKLKGETYAAKAEKTVNIANAALIELKVKALEIKQALSAVTSDLKYTRMYKEQGNEALIEPKKK